MHSSMRGVVILLLVAATGSAEAGEATSPAANFKPVLIPVPETRPDEPTRELEALGFSPDHLFAWVERTGSDAVLRISDLATDRVILERPWPPYGDPDELRARGIAPLAATKVDMSASFFRGEFGFVATPVGRALLVGRNCVWKKVAETRSDRASVYAWLGSPLEPRAALFLDDGGFRVVGVHLSAGFDAPRSARGLYEQARLGIAATTALSGDECAAEVASRIARKNLVAAIEKDPSLRTRARSDFKVLERSISFRALVGTLDLTDPAAVANAIGRTEWIVPQATCGGGLYDYVARFTSNSFEGHCPDLEDPETPRPARPQNRYRVKGTTLLFEDGTSMELTFKDGIAAITGGPYPFAEATFRCQ